MPIHDWSRVDAAIFQDFRHGGITGLSRLLNGGVLPSDHYALIEPFEVGLGPDIMRRPAPEPRPISENDPDFYRRKQNSVAIRLVGDDRLVAEVDMISPANKISPDAIERCIRKVSDLVDRCVHLLIIDLIPPGPHDPRGIHGMIWGDIGGDYDVPPPDKPLALVAYESDLQPAAYIAPVAVGEALPLMPLFLGPGKFVEVPLERWYQAAWEDVPRRWKAVLESPGPGGSV
jgi:hypothetical protein